MGAYINALREEGSKEEILEQLEAKMDEIERLRAALDGIRYYVERAKGHGYDIDPEQLEPFLPETK